MLEAESSLDPSGGAAALPLLQQLHSAAGDALEIKRVVREAERSLEDLHALAEVYGVAVDVYGHAQSPQDYDYRDLCVKQMRALCRLNPTEAREFHNRLRTQSAGRADARIYEARAAMEERLGDTAKAVKMLQEGLRVGAQPSEVLQRVLTRLQPPAETSAGSAAPTLSGDAPLAGLSAARGSTAVPSDSPAVADAAPAERIVAERPPAGSIGRPAMLFGAKAPALEPAEAAGAELFAAAFPATSPRQEQAPPEPLAAAFPATSPRHEQVVDSSRQTAMSSRSLAPLARGPRILGLGCPQRRMLDGVDEEEEEGDDRVDEEEEVEQAEGPDGSWSQQADGRITATMTMLPLSPIKEVATPAKESSAGSTRLSYQGAASCDGTPRHQMSRQGTPSAAVNAPPLLPPRAVAGASSAAQAAPLSPQGSPHGLKTPKGTELSADSSAAPCGPCASPSAPPREKGSKLVHVNGVPYVQLRTLGRGGSSKVYLVQDQAGETLALKRVATDNPTQLEAFLNEVTLLRQLSQYHDRVIQVIDAEVDREKGRINIVMEAGDMDLGRFLQSEPGLRLAQIQDLWRQMLEAVQVVHSERIVHSDLKPGNFLLVKGKLKVIDFGIAKRISNDTTNISRDASVGTLSYMAPEAVKQGSLKLGRASDIWSLGIILYQMVYERPPFAELEPMQRLLKLSDPTLRIQFPPGHRLEGHSNAVKSQLTEVLSRCLQRDPKRRPSLQELLAHPFLRTSTTLPREALRSTVEALMSRVLRVAGEALKASDAPALEEDWQVLSDEVWEHLLSHASDHAGDGEGPPPEFLGLAPLRDSLRRLADSRAPARPLASSSNVNINAGRQVLGGLASTKEPKRSAAPNAPALTHEPGDKENASPQEKRLFHKTGRAAGLRPGGAPLGPRAVF